MELPTFLRKFFWGDDFAELSLKKHKKYISRTILDRGDLSAVNWLFRHITPTEAKQSLSEKMRKNLLIFGKYIFPKMNTAILAPQTQKVLNLVVPSLAISNFYLSGGTALAMHLGHRESEDLDFFCEHSFDPLKLQSKLEKISQLENLELGQNTLNASVEEVKLQFLNYPYPLLEPLINWNGLQVSSILDIALTKLQTVGARGSKKDFIDIYFILQHFSLPQLFEKLPQKYQSSNFSLPHILKSLIYFVDADGQPMPRMHQKADWEEIKASLINEVKKFKF